MSEHYDVVQIGFGPVGQTFAALLGQSGHRVGAFERSPECYPLPRAGHVDHEIMRIFQSISAAASENGSGGDVRGLHRQPELAGRGNVPGPGTATTCPWCRVKTVAPVGMEGP